MTGSEGLPRTNSGASHKKRCPSASGVVVIVDFVEIGGLGKLALLKQRSAASDGSGPVLSLYLWQCNGNLKSCCSRVGIHLPGVSKFTTRVQRLAGQ